MQQLPVAVTMAERLQKILAQHGIASRRQAEQLISTGQVRVNGELAHLGQRADPECDRIEVNHTPLPSSQRPQLYYFLLHKPKGVVSTCDDPQGRPTVLSSLPPALQSVGIHPVGRLDAYSTGALVLTNDGDFTFRLTHPRHDVPKTYRVRLEGAVSAATADAWRRGVDLDGRPTLPAQVRVLTTHARHSDLEIILREGRNRQIRRVALALGHRVLDLHRVAVGSIALGQLQVGAYRALSSAEIEALLAESSVPAAVSPVAGSMVTSPSVVSSLQS